MKTVIQECGRCNHPFQDRRYGKNRRVFNVKLDPKKGCTCTVCGRTDKVSGIRIEEETPAK